MFSTGIGLGAQVVSGFAEAHRSAIAAGFPDNIDTHGLISGEGDGEPDKLDYSSTNEHQLVNN